MRLTESPARRRAKRLLRRFVELGQRVGVDILPHHFYSQIPTFAELRKQDGWKKPLSMAGIRGLEIESQLAFVRECAAPGNYAPLAGRDIFAEACADNGEHGYGPVEANFLYGFMARRRPARVVQVGCGVATSVMLRAADDCGFETQVTCIDPFPTDFLKRAEAQGRLTLHAERAQDVPLEVLTSLGPGDLLFVDSTHTVKPGSEVNRIILEVLPRLVDGTFVHYHDIWFPYDYTPSVMTTDFFFWGESTLLQAFLVNNERVRVLASLSTLHYWAQDELKAFIPSYRPIEHDHGYATGLPASGDSSAGHFPSSLYLQVSGDPAE